MAVGADPEVVAAIIAPSRPLSITPTEPGLDTDGLQSFLLVLCLQVGLPPQQCAPLVRKTITGRRCSFPFTWEGIPRDDCVWTWGIQACPVEVTDHDTDDEGDPSGGSSDGYQTANRTRVVWEQCAADYVTSWEQPSVEMKKR